MTIIEEYLKACKNTNKALKAWLEEDRKGNNETYTQAYIDLQEASAYQGGIEKCLKLIGINPLDIER